jgi:hypothetical protein
LEIYYPPIGNGNITGTLSIGNAVHVSSKSYRSIVFRKVLPAHDYLAYLSPLLFQQIKTVTHCFKALDSGLRRNDNLFVYLIAGVIAMPGMFGSKKSISG